MTQENTTMVLRNVEDGLRAAVNRSTDAGGIDDEAAGLPQDALEPATDAGAPPNLALMESDLLKAVRQIESEGHVSQKRVIELVRRASNVEAEHAHRHGHVRGFKKGLAHGRRHHHHHPEDPSVHWRRSPQMHGFRNDIIDRYRRLHGGNVREGLGYYYSTIEIQMEVQGTPSDAAFVLPVSSAPGNPVINQCFQYGIDDEIKGWFGGPHIANAGDTNLQEPGQGLYQDELFIIEACAAYLTGIKIAYPDPATMFSPEPTGDILKALSGQELVWDRAGRILPVETFNQFNDSCEIANAIAESSTFYFNWVDKAIGGDKGQNTKLIDRFSRIPSVGRRGLRETSGGGMSHDLPRGYVWCIDRMFQASSDMGGNGLYNAEIHTDSTVLFPFQPIRLFGSDGPVVPTGLALYWQFVVYGTSMTPGSVSDRYDGQLRKRM